MKKKILAGLLSAAMVLSMAACGGGDATEAGSVPVSESKTEEQVKEQASESSETAQEESMEENGEEEGKWIRIGTEVPGDTENVVDVEFYAPSDYAVKHETSAPEGVKGGFDTEPFYFIVKRQTAADLVAYGEIEVEGLEGVIPAYKEWLVRDLAGLHGYDSGTSDLVVDGTEMVDVNGKEMCKYMGTYTWVEKDYYANTETTGTRSFVGYAAQASNGAYVYWIVVGPEDLADEVAADAETFAKTYKEYVEE